MKQVAGFILALAFFLLTVSVMGQPVISSLTTNQIIPNGNNATFNLSAYGSGQLWYQWYFVNTNIQITAEAFADTLYGFVYDTELSGSGYGYTTVPQVQFVGGGGSGAAGYAVVSNGSVVDIIVTNAGEGYTSPPTVVIDPPSILVSGATGPSLYLNSISTNNIGNYYVIVTNLYGSVTSSVVTLNMPAYIQAQPQGTTIWQGGTASLGVLAGGGGPYNYQWSLNGATIVGATNALFSTGAASANAAGVYLVAVSNLYGGIISSGVVLTVNLPPQTPANQVVVNGGIGNLGSAFSGSGIFQYQWILNGTNVATGTITNGIITTVAGNVLGDGGPATAATLSDPTGVACDALGNIFIVDYNNQRIRKVDTNGTIITVAGNGAYGFSGDGGNAGNASLASPSGIAIDPLGNLYIADQGNQRIRKVDTNGIITTIAGNGSSGFFADGGLATNATLSRPSSIAVDAAGNLYIGDSGNQRVRKVDIYGIITTVAGGAMYGSYNNYDGIQATNASFSSQISVAIDGMNNIFIADQYNERVYRVSTNGLLRTVAGNGSYGYNGNIGDRGSATNANLAYPTSVFTDSAGNVFIADQNNERIRVVNSNGVISTIAGNGNAGFSGDGNFATNSTIYNPTGVTVDMFGNIFIADSFNNRIRKVTKNGIITSVAGNPSLDNGFAVSTSLNQPKATAIDAVGNLFIADTGNQRIRKVDTFGFITTVAGTGSYGFQGDGYAATSAMLGNPVGIALDPAGNLYIADQVNGRIRKVGTNGIITTVAGGGYYWYLGDGDQATNAYLVNPTSVAVDRTGNIYIADTGNQRIRKVGTDGIIVTIGGNGIAGYSGDGGLATSSWINSPNGISIDAIGNVFFTDQYNQRIRKIAANGIITTIAGNGSSGYSGDGGLATSATLSNPSGVTIDAVGNLFIADQSNQRIRKVSANGIISTVVGSVSSGYGGDGGLATNALLSGSLGVSIDAVGNLFIADSGNQRIRKVDTNGIITTFAGNVAGDGTSALLANLSSPNGVAIDNSGNFFIADTGNQRIRKVGANGIIATVAGNGNYGFAGDGNPAVNASLANPASAAADNLGNLFIADQGNQRVRKVDTNGIITTVAGNGNLGYAGDGYPAVSARLYNPSSVAVDALGNLFISDVSNQRVRKVDTNGIITTIAGNGGYGFSGDGGSATNAPLANPLGVAVDAGENVYIVDQGNMRIRKVDTNGIITTVAGNGGNGYSGDGCLATNTSLSSPSGIAVDTFGNLFVAEQSGIRIRKVAPNGIITTVAGMGGYGYSGDGGPATNAWMHSPTCVAVDKAGNFLIADPQNNVIRKVTYQNPSLVLNNATTNIAGNYQFVISDAFGSITSSVTTLTIAFPPSILQQPQSLSQVQGSNISFTLSANGTAPLNYQWFMTDGQQSTATASPYVIKGFVVAATLASGGSGYLAVPAINIVGGSGTGAGGLAVISNRMVSTIVITNAGFGYTNPPIIQIQSPGPISLSGQVVSNLDLFTVTSNSAGNYFVVITNSYGSVTSSLAALTVTLPAPNPLQNIPPPVLFVSLINGSLAMHFTGLTNYPYILEAATNLATPTRWQPFFTNTADGNGYWSYATTNLIAAPLQVYRIRAE